jgi:c-di-GMP-binding flagellar brake protein YcgR
MALLKALFSRFLGKTHPSQQTAADRYQQLETLQRRHAFIEVKFPRIERSFQSMILELHAEEGYVLIDELYPAEGRQFLLEGDSAEINGKSVGITVSFFSRLLAREVAEDAPVYRMELPEEIGASFRRTSYRVYVEREAGLVMDARRADGSSFDAHIINLSTDGIKVSLHGDVSKELDKTPLLENCRIQLPNGIDIDCTIEIRNAYVMRTPSLNTMIGGKLTVDMPSHRTKLDMYLATVQRKQRRRESRMS